MTNLSQGTLQSPQHAKLPPPLPLSLSLCKTLQEEELSSSLNLQKSIGLHAESPGSHWLAVNNSRKAQRRGKKTSPGLVLQCGKNCTTKGLGTVGPAKLRSRPITSSVSLRPPCTAPLAHKEKATFAHSLSDFNTPLCTLPCFQPLAAHCIGFLVHTHTHTHLSSQWLSLTPHM